MDHQKVSVFAEKGVVFKQKSAKRGLFLHPENTDGLPVSYGSGGTGVLRHVGLPSLCFCDTVGGAGSLMGATPVLLATVYLVHLIHWQYRQEALPA